MGANATTSVPKYTAGDVLTAANLSITNSGIPVFADSSARTNAFGGTGEKTLAEGQFAYLEDDNKTYVYDGSSWIEVGGAGLVLISSTTIGSAVSSVTVSNAFSATYDNYRIIVSGGVASTSTSITLQLGASTTGYYSAGYFNAPNADTPSGTNDNNASSFQNAFGGSTNNLDGVVELYGPNLAKTTGYSSERRIHATTGTQCDTRGFHNATTQHTAFTISSGAATMTGGTIRVYGYRN